MKVKKILNNNTVIAVNESKEEVIVMEPGLGFRRKKGDVFSRNELQKIFVLQDRELEGQYSQLLKNVEPISSEIAEKIISHATERYGMKLNDMIHLTLTDHIDGQIKRIRKGIHLSNQLILEISRVYQNEFQTGKYGNSLIREYLYLESALDEAAFIALHLVNSQVGVMEDGKEIQTTLRFVMHLKFLRKHICDGNVYRDDETLYETVSQAYPETLDCVNKIVNIIRLKYKKDVSTEEKAYLIVYVKKLLQDCKN